MDLNPAFIVAVVVLFLLTAYLFRRVEAAVDARQLSPRLQFHRDGQFIAYNSNNGLFAGRIDLFVVVAARRSASPAGF